MKLNSGAIWQHEKKDARCGRLLLASEWRRELSKQYTSAVDNVDVSNDEEAKTRY
ncbi:MAG: hypothetical protein HOC71_10675 [Candidatus Latescibacteria bacterium]|nr:hypothetical protein [Candidatus Latescibacterota bacterium]